MNEQEFLTELFSLMNKYGVSLHSYDDYNGEESYSGTHYNFEGDDIYLPLEYVIEERRKRCKKTEASK